MARKGKYTLSQQEEELGSKIDQNLNQEQPTNPTLQNSIASLLPSQIKGKEQRTMIKQLWLDEDTYNRCVQAQANRKKQKQPGSFDALAYDALVFFLDSLDKS